VRKFSALKAVLTIGLLTYGGWSAFAAGTESIASPTSPGPLIETSSASTPPQTLAPMLSRVAPAIVNISVQGTVPIAQNPLFQDPVFRRFFGIPENSEPQKPLTERFQAAGSGVIYDADHGYVITNHHVVERADKILVTLIDRREINARLVASDPQTDIAILKIEASRLTSLPLGNSKALQVGDYVVAIGNPYGVGQTATFGIVSAVGRTGLGIESYEDFIQTDASINPGNSGGALIDMTGRLVGISTAILSASGGNVGVGFAIPTEFVKNVAEQLIAHGKVSRGALGVTVQDLTPALARAMGIDIFAGALVSGVLPQSAAVKVGIKEGDVIVELDGVAITNSSQLRSAIGQRPPGSVVRLKTLRNGIERIAAATLDPLPIATATTAQNKTQENAPLFGMTLNSIPQDHPQFGKIRGVYVANVTSGSGAQEAGIRSGDIIISVDRAPVQTPSELVNILKVRKSGIPALIQVWRGDGTLYLALE